MQIHIDNLGKVAVTVEKEYWDVNKDYNKLTIVEAPGNEYKTYISRKPVPAGTVLTNREYWIPFSSLREEIVIDFNSFVASLTQAMQETKQYADDTVEQGKEDITDIKNQGIEDITAIKEEAMRIITYIAENGIDSSVLAPESVTSEKIKSGAVLSRHIGEGEVKSVNIGAGEVKSENIGEQEVKSANIGNREVKSENIGEGAVKEEHIAPGAITTDKLDTPVITQLQTIMDEVPTAGSVKPINSEGVLAHGSAFDVSEYNKSEGVLATYETLAAALNAVPATSQRGGMSIKFILRTNTGTEESPVYKDEYVQYRLMKPAWSNDDDDWQGVTGEIKAGSRDLVESGGVAEAIGRPCIMLDKTWTSARREILGTIVMKAGNTYEFQASRTSTNTSYAYICTGDYSSQGTTYVVLSMGSGVTESSGTYTATVDTPANIVVAGSNAIIDFRLIISVSNNNLLWTDSQMLSAQEKAQVLSNLGIDMESKLDKQSYRGAAIVFDCISINFNNTEHKVEIGGARLANPANNTRLTINATDVDYTFSTGTTDAWWLVYSFVSSSYVFKSAGTSAIGDIVIAAIITYGAGTTNGKVKEVSWCAVENYKINGVNVDSRVSKLETDVPAIETNLTNSIKNPMGLLEAKLVEAELTLAAGGIYNGNNNSEKQLRCDNYIEVEGGTTIEVIHAEDITVRISEYGVSKNFLRQTAYSAFEKLTLRDATKYVRISANGYVDRGITTPAVSDFQEGDFGFKYYKSGALENIKNQVGTFAKAPISDYEDGPFWIDASTWKAKSSTYAAKIIPVVGGTKMICTAGSLPTRIAFANTYDPSTIVPGTTHIDGTGNQNTGAGATKTYIIPDTCTYIVLNSKYGSKNSLPVSLIIDGKEYMKAIPEAVVDLTRKVIENEEIEDDYTAQVDNIQKGVITNILGRNIHRDAAVRAVGKKAVDTDILPLSFIHVSDIHTKSDNYKCFENACEFYEHYANIKFMIATGDLVWDSYADPMTYYDLALQKTTKPVLNVIGNHDTGQYKSNIGLASQSSDKQCYDRYIAPYVESWDVVQPADADSEGKSYYYKDFTAEKVRLIVLNEFETDYEINAGGTGLVYSREYRAMRQAQVTWLIETLSSTPNDYGVIIATHQIPGLLKSEDNPFVSIDLVNNNQMYNVYSSDKEWLAKIINAYATKSSLTLSVTQTGAVVQNDATLNCDCDFASVQSEFICVICGHTHRDYIGHLTNFPYVTVLCVGADNLKYTSGFQPRAAGTPSEDLFNVVNIDRNRKTIKIIRIGSDASVTGQIRDQMIMKYV